VQNRHFSHWMGTFPAEWAFPQWLRHFPNKLGTSPMLGGSAIECLQLTKKIGCYTKLDIIVYIFIYRKILWFENRGAPYMPILVVLKWIRHFSNWMGISPTNYALSQQTRHFLNWLGAFTTCNAPLRDALIICYHTAGPLSRLLEVFNRWYLKGNNRGDTMIGRLQKRLARRDNNSSLSR
jgi:hypothetical protein